MSSIVIGASGKIGKYFFNTKKRDLLLTYNKNKIKNGIKFNILTDKIEDLVNKNKITKAVILSAYSDPDYCIKNRKKSKLLNVVKTKKLISYFIKKNIYFIFYSSEFIYDGKKGNYSEMSKSNPVNLYGKQKLMIEKFIKKKAKFYSIFRIAKTYGDDLRDNTLVSYFIEKSKQKNSTVLAATDQKFSPLYSRDLVKITHFFLEKKIIGIFNVGGPKSYSRYDLYVKFNNLVKNKEKFNKVKIIKKNLNQFKFDDKRGKNVSFNIKKIKRFINFRLTDIEDVLKRTAV